jgi:hypothetical protein
MDDYEGTTSKSEVAGPKAADIKEERQAKAHGAKMTINVAVGWVNHDIMLAFVKSSIVPWFGLPGLHFWPFLRRMLFGYADIIAAKLICDVRML